MLDFRFMLTFLIVIFELFSYVENNIAPEAMPWKFVVKDFRSKA